MALVAETIRLPEGPYRQRLAWTTAVMTAADGSEQRQSAGATPRVYLSAALSLSDAEIRALRARQRATATAVAAYELPRVSDSVVTTTEFASGNYLINVDDISLAGWATAGQRVAVIGPGGVGVRGEIAKASGLEIELTDTTPIDIPAGARVYPLDPILLDDAQEVQRWPANLSRWQISGRCSSTSGWGGTGASVTTHDSLPVLPWRPLGPGDESYPAGLSYQDAGIGAVASRTLWDAARVRRSGAWLIRTAAERQAWRALLATLRGRWRPFLAPTWRPDLTIHTQPAGSATALRVVEDYAGLWGTSPSHTRIQLECADGSVLYRTITGTASGSGYQDLTIAALPSTIPGGSVRAVSFLELMRLDADDATIDYSGSPDGRIALSLVTVPG